MTKLKEEKEKANERLEKKGQEFDFAHNVWKSYF